MHIFILTQLCVSQLLSYLFCLNYGHLLILTQLCTVLFYLYYVPIYSILILHIFILTQFLHFSQLFSYNINYAPI